MPLIPDKVEKLNGVAVKTYLLTQHNPNRIAMPSIGMSAPIGVTIHNTGAISVASNTTPAEQYTRATINGNMKDVRVHFYVDDTCAWQNLPLNLSGWHAADGSGNGNRRTIAFEVIGNSAKAEENAAKLAAYFLKKYNKTVDNGLFTHTHWLNVRDGKTGSIDYLNTAFNKYKMCPVYILPHWATFKANVKAELTKLNGGAAQEEPKPVVAKVYRIRKTWADAKSQIGAYASLDNAKKSWKEGYTIYDPDGKAVYPVTAQAPIAPKVEEKTSDIDVTYRVYAKNRWLPEVNNLEDYAGIRGSSMSAVMVKTSKGQVKYRVHQRNSNWMSWVTGYNINDIMKGLAGMPGLAFDAIQIQLVGVSGYDVKYRVSPIGQDYYPWVYGSNTNDFAGYAGKYLDRLEIEIVKK